MTSGFRFREQHQEFVRGWRRCRRKEVEAQAGGCESSCLGGGLAVTSLPTGESSHPMKGELIPPFYVERNYEFPRFRNSDIREGLKKSIKK